MAQDVEGLGAVRAGLCARVAWQYRVDHFVEGVGMSTDLPDLIAGALGVSRGTAYDMMREALAEQPAQQEPVAWMCHPFGDAECEFSERQECENCVPLYTTPQAQPAQSTADKSELETVPAKGGLLPAQQEPVAEVKAKMTGGNVGIATVIHEIHSPIREPLQPGDKLYAAYRWVGWDVEQVWSERIFGIDMRFENVQDAIAFRKKLEEATTPQAQPAREPLTDEQILEIKAQFVWTLDFQFGEFARAIEAAHGITKGKT